MTTGFGVALAVKFKSAFGAGGAFTVTLVLAALFAVFGSASVAVTLEELLNVPAALEVRTRVIWAVALSASEPKLHEKIPLVTPQDWLGLL